MTRPRSRPRARAAARERARPALDARGRLPPPDRSHAWSTNERARAPAARVRVLAAAVQAHLARHRDHERHQSGLLSRRARSRSRHAREQVERRSLGVPYLDFVAPGLLAATAMQIASERGVLAGDGLVQVDAAVLRDAGDTARAARHRRRPPALDDDARRVDERDLPGRDRGVRRRRLVVGDPRAAGRGAARRGVHGAVRRLRGDAGVRRGLRSHQPFRRRADVPVLRNVLPGDTAAAAARVARVRDAALARRRPLPRADARHGSRSGARSATSRTCRCSSSSVCVWARRTYAAEAASSDDRRRIRRQPRPTALRAQPDGLPARLDDHLLRRLRAALLPLLDGHRARPLRRQGARSRTASSSTTRASSRRRCSRRRR